MIFRSGDQLEILSLAVLAAAAYLGGSIIGHGTLLLLGVVAAGLFYIAQGIETPSDTSQARRSPPPPSLHPVSQTCAVCNLPFDGKVDHTECSQVLQRTMQVVR